MASLGMLPEGDTAVSISFRRPLPFQRLGGMIGDIPESSATIYLSLRDAETVGKWGLLINDHISAPVRVFGREHVPDGAARVAYALRTPLRSRRVPRASCPRGFSFSRFLARRRRCGIGSDDGSTRSGRSWSAHRRSRSDRPRVSSATTERTSSASTRLHSTFWGCSSGDRVVVQLGVEERLGASAAAHRRDAESHAGAACRSRPGFRCANRWATSPRGWDAPCTCRPGCPRRCGTG